ncbi:MAG: hypothetical protein AAFY60_04645, partial [Myxococcota bacterium]
MRFTLYDAEILDLRDETRAGNVRTFVLKRPSDFEFQPGQFVWFSVSERDAYPMAIASGTLDPNLEFSIRKSGGTAGVFEKAIGDRITISGPEGSPFPLPSQPTTVPVLLVAGGTGVTPIRSTLRSLPDGQPVSAVIGARSCDDLLYLDELSAHGSVSLTVDEPENWTGAHGLVTDHLEDVDPQAHAFVCGPNAMMSAVKESLLKRGLSLSSIFLSVQALDSDGKVLGPV